MYLKHVSAEEYKAFDIVMRKTLDFVQKKTATDKKTSNPEAMINVLINALVFLIVRFYTDPLEGANNVAEQIHYGVKTNAVWQTKQ
jgi:hypothetical protein